MYGEEIKTLRNRPRSCLDFDFCCAKSNGFDFMVMVMGTKSNLAYVPAFRRYFFCHFGRRTNCQREMVSSRLLNEVQQCRPQWGVQATERSCDSKMEGLRPDKFAFALATNTPAGCLSDRTFLRKQNGGVSLRQVPVCRPMLNKCTTIIDKPCVQDYNKIIGKDDNKGMR